MSTYPTKIVLLRDAEKSAAAGGQGLSPSGRKRAEFIPEFVIRNFGRPDYIFATTPTRASLCPLLTVLPLWQSLDGAPTIALINPGTEMELNWAIMGVNSRGRQVGGDEFVGKNIVVCFNHEVMPMFMRSLGAAPSDCPATWPEEDFSSVYVLSPDNGRLITTRHEMMF